MITVEELIIQSLYHRMVVVNVRRTPTAIPTRGRVDALGLLISGAQRMRSEMGARGQLPTNQGASSAADPASSSSSSGGGGGGADLGSDTDPPPPPDSSVLQVTSRQSTVDFSEEVQTILDTGEIKLVKAMQRTAETQTDLTPVWLFGFDPTASSQPPPPPQETVTLEDGTVVAAGAGAENPVVHDIPAVDLSRFEQFSVVHYSDIREPDKRKLVMIQTPGSRLYKPEELCSENMSVHNKGRLLDVPRPASRRQLFDRKSKSLDNSALTSSSSSRRRPDDSRHHESALKRQEHVTGEEEEAPDPGESGGVPQEEEGDASLQEPDIDSGIWDMVQGRSAPPPSGRDVKSEDVIQCAKSSGLQAGRGPGEEEKEDVAAAGGAAATAPPSGEEASSEDYSLSKELDGVGEQDGATWQQLCEQLEASDGDRPTMSYRVFHIQDQVSLETEVPPAVQQMDLPSAEWSSAPLSCSTPRTPAIDIQAPFPHTPEEEEEAEEAGKPTSPPHTETATKLEGNTTTTAAAQARSTLSSSEQEKREGEEEEEEDTDTTEDSGWLFDKIPAMQGSLIHSPSSPSSPRPFPSGPREEEITPTGEEETMTIQYITVLQKSPPEAEEDVVSATSPQQQQHPGLVTRDSAESSDTVTEEDNLDRPEVLEKPGEDEGGECTTREETIGRVVKVGEELVGNDLTARGAEEEEGEGAVGERAGERNAESGVEHGQQGEVCEGAMKAPQASSVTDREPPPGRAVLFDEQESIPQSVAESLESGELTNIGLDIGRGGSGSAAAKVTEVTRPEVSSPTSASLVTDETSQATSMSNGDVYESCDEAPAVEYDEDQQLLPPPLSSSSFDGEESLPADDDTVPAAMVKPWRSAAFPPARPARPPPPLQSPPLPLTAHHAPPMSPMTTAKPTSPLARTFPARRGEEGEHPPTPPPPTRGCVVHRTGAQAKQAVIGSSSPQRTLGLQSLLSEDCGTLINGNSSLGSPSHVDQHHHHQHHHHHHSRQSPRGRLDDVYLVNRDGTLTNASSGVVYRSGARPVSPTALPPTDSGGGGGGGAGGGGGGYQSGGLQGLNSLMVRSTSSTVVHSHVITELTAARSRLHVPDLRRRTPDRHSVASSDSEYASVNSSLATSPTSTSVEELVSVGSDTCLLSEVMPVATYADWMAELPKRLHAVPLNQLAIPGSNISFAIESEMRTDMSFSKCNLEMADFLRKLPPLAVFDNFRRIMKDIWRSWMPKQLLSIQRQLEAGVRYLDLHVTRYRGALYGEHGLYTRSLKHYLRQVDEFTQQHPKEVLILHFQRLTNLTPKDKRSLVTLLFQFFGARLCRQMPLSQLTLEELWSNRKQLIVVFPDADMELIRDHIFAGLVWSSKAVRSSLPRKQTTSELMTYLESVYDEARDPGELHVLQAVVSPDMAMVFGDYEHKSMRSLTLHETSPYLKVWLPGKDKLNVVAVDFVGIYDLTGEIIRLNDDKKAETIV